MMMFLQGQVRSVGDGYALVVREGLGYKILFPADVVRGFAGEVELYLHEVIRDNERELFGFTSIDQLEIFWQLIGISGVGPKIAQKIVFADTIEAVRRRVMQGDLSFLTSISGVGKKTAQKIILELKGVLTDPDDGGVVDVDAVEALVSLGYSKSDAQAALEGIEAETTDDRIRFALKALAR